LSKKEKTREKKAASQVESEQICNDEQYMDDFKVKNVVFYPFFKRAFDICASFLAIVVLIIPLLIVAIAIKIDSKGRIFYVSDRIGKRGKVFKLYKFRSMEENAEDKLASLLKDNQVEGDVTFKLKDDPRITKVGKFLRKTSIDELPQLFNILKGDMSFVGPRPCTPREFFLYTPKDMLRLSVPQGLTGEWQTHGRSNTTFEQMIDMDLDYIQHKRGFFYDLYLIFQAAMQYDDFMEIIQQKEYTASYTASDGSPIEATWTSSNQFTSGAVTVPDGVQAVGGKTGTTTAAKSCLVQLFTDEQGQRYVAIILGCKERGILYEEMQSFLSNLNN